MKTSQIRPRLPRLTVILGHNRKDGFVVGQFFLLIGFDMLRKSVQETVGDKNFESKDMMGLIFPGTVNEKD